jgi:ubiquinone biosynthesis protein
VFAKNGFQNVAEKIDLGRFMPARFSRADVERFTQAERLRMAFEELGPTFVKLGQLLATRPDLIPVEYVEEFKRLHDQVAPVPFSEIQEVIEEQFGTGISQVFREIDPVPLAAASIAQAHRAILTDGSEVVVKVQRPGIAEVIADDVNILYYIAELLHKYVPETRPFNPIGVVDEFFKTLELETNFIVEANNIRRFQENFKNDPSVKIPGVYFEYSGKKVLVLEALKGVPLSQRAALEQEGIDRLQVMRAGVRCYFRQVFKFGLFHGDLHAGNLFILPDNRIGLIDFGIVGRLSRRVQDAVANMFVALYTEDYERLAYEYVELAPYSEDVDVDAFAKDLQDLLAPYFGLSMRNVNLGRLLLDSAGTAARYGLVLPSELMLFFKSIVTIEGMAKLLMSDFNLLDHALEFANEIVKSKYDPARIKEEMALFGRDASQLLKTLPRQLKQFARKVNHPDFAFQVSLVELEDLKRSTERASNILFLGLVIGSLILSASLGMFLQRGPFVFDIPLVSALGYGLAGALGLVAFYNYIRR